MSTTASERLVGVRAKIKRAKEHIRELQSRADAFTASDPYVIEREHDSESGNLLFKAQLKAPIPVGIPLVVGDILNNLRAALDHLAYQLVEANGGTPTVRTYFPIFESSQEYEAGRAAKVKGMSQEAVDRIDATKPYQGGNDPFWHIHNLNRIDKHRLLIATAFGSHTLRLSINQQEAVLPTSRPVAIALEESTTLLSISAAARIRGVIKEMDEEPQFTFQITFGEPEVLKGQPLVPTFQQYADFVSSIVDQFVSLL